MPTKIETPYTEIEAEVLGHCKKNYERKLSARVKKLGEEYGELAEAVCNRNKAGVVEEAADCAIVLIDILGLLDCSMNQAVRVKLEILKSRLDQ